MKGILTKVKRYFTRKIRNDRLNRIEKILEEGLPLDRTWKVCEELSMDLHFSAEEMYKIRADQSGFLIRTPWPSIETFLTTVHELRNQFRDEVKIDRNWSSFEKHTIMMASFLVSEDGHYLPVDSINRLLEIVRDLLGLISQAEHEELGVTAFNMRALIPFFVRLRDTLLDLNRLQLAL